jgi:hypothetical protein
MVKSFIACALLAVPAAVYGQKWVPTSAPALAWTCLSASADGTDLAAAVHGGGVYVSASSGRTWKQTSAPKMPWTSIASSADGKKLIAASSPGSLYLSADSGSTWIIGSNAPSTNWFSVASSADGSTLAAAVANGSVYWSTNAGAAWNDSQLPESPWSSVACSADGASLIAVANPGSIYTSTNSGSDWASNSAPALSWSAAAISADGSKLFAAATLGGIFMSTNAGQTWTQTTATNTSWFAIACSADGTNLLAGAIYNGLYRSTNSGLAWVKMQSPALGWSSTAMSADGTVLYAAAYGKGIYVPRFPFLATRYEGLFYDTNAVAVPSSGFVTLSSKSTGRFTAQLQLSGKSYSWSGAFSTAGFSSNSLARSGASPLTVRLQVDPHTGDPITGQVSDGTWTVPLTAYAATFSKSNACPQAGRFTLAFPGSDFPALEPGGDGYATLTVDALGNVSVGGKLAEGTAFSRKTLVSSGNETPLFATLYSGKGLLLGWLTFSNLPNSDVSGLVKWIAPSTAKPALYLSGFTSDLEAAGSSYRFTNGVPVLNISTGLVSLVYGDIPEGITNRVALTAASKVVNLSSNKLQLAVTPSSGLFKGSVVIPGTTKAVSFSGVVLQKQDIGAGFFLGTSESGRVVMEPEDSGAVP